MGLSPARGALCRPPSVRRLVSVCLVGAILASTGAVISPFAAAPAGAPSFHKVPLATAGRPFVGEPPAAVGSIGIELYNPGGSPTGPYDQPVVINSSRYADLINSNWTNGVAEYTLNSTPIDGWIESGASNLSGATLLWLRMGSLPAYSWTNVSIWFWAKTSFNLSARGSMGESPLLSAHYAAFDNGARVFLDYANFSGTSLPPGWSTLGNWAGSVNHGLTVAASSHMGAVESALPAPQPSDLVVETAAAMTGPGGPVNLFVSATPGFNTANQFYPNAYALEPGASGTTTAALASSDASGIAQLNVPIAAAPADFRQGDHVVGLEWRHANNSTEIGSMNYLPFVSQINSTNGPMTDIGLGSYCNVNCTSWNVSWVRARVAPDPMPEVLGAGSDLAGVVAASTPIATDPSLPVSFACRATASLPSPTFSWNFGDGGTDSGPSVSHAYARPGMYLATCEAASASGAAGLASAPVIVNPNLAILLFQAVPSTVSIGSSLNLIVNVTGGTAPFSYVYSGLPPGCPAYDVATLTCLPGETGTFAVKITVSDAVGESTTDSITISVTTPPPNNGPGLTPAEGYALGGAIAGVVVLAGVLPVLLWTRRSSVARSPRPSAPREPRSAEEAPERDEPESPEG